MSPAGPPPLTTSIALPFDPMELTFSPSVNKLYVIGMEGGPPLMKAFAVSLTTPTGQIERLDTAIKGVPDHIVINDKLRRGYALMGGAIKVFGTDSDTLVSTSQTPSCSPEVLAINPTTGMVYGGGVSQGGECLVQFDPDGRIVRENTVAPNTSGKTVLVRSIAVDSASGDVLYMNALSVARADSTLKEKWRTPLAGPGDGLAMGFEPTTNTAYVDVGADPIISPTRISVLDGDTGKAKGEFSGPGHSSDFAATGDGRLFAAFHNSSDVYVLSHGASVLTKFASLGNIPRQPSDWEWLEVDPAGHRLFVAPSGNGRNVLVYQY